MHRLGLILITMLIFSFTVDLVYKKNDKDLALQVTALFRAYRKTISTNKEAIHNAKVYFTDPAARVLQLNEKAKMFYKEMTGQDYPKNDMTAAGRIRTVLERAVRLVVFDISSGKLSLDWTGKNKYVKKWDGKLLPARFANMVTKKFNRLTNNKVRIKLTTSDKLLVNNSNAPDEWESQIIEKYLINLTSNSVNQSRDETVNGNYRFILPEFYGKSCIGCHGTSKGQEGDMIHPSKIKRKLNDFAGAISISFQN